MSGVGIERVSSFKLLGVIISSTLKWDEHAAMICSKTASKMHFLKIIRRAGISQADALCFYMTVIRPVLGYTCPVWHSMHTKKLTSSIESQQIRAMRIIYGDGKYEEVLVTAGIPTLQDRRERLISNFHRRRKGFTFGGHTYSPSPHPPPFPPPPLPSPSPKPARGSGGAL